MKSGHIFKNITLIIVSGMSLFFSCSESDQQELKPLEMALIQSGNNRKELEKVLNRYKQNPNDSLKYQAACFLIENMPYYTYYEGELLDNYLTFYNALMEAHRKKQPFDGIADSIMKRFGEYSSDKLHRKHDLLEIDSAYLCQNIDWAFKVRDEQPWSKNISFEDFCEYILPYRIDDEKLVYWREQYYKKYNPLLDSLRNSESLAKENPIQAVYCLMKKIAKSEDVRFTTSSPADLPHVGPDLAELKMGTCREFTDFVVYVCRALGIPVAIDFMPIRANENVGHFWAAFQDKYGVLYYQDFPQEVMLVHKGEIQNHPKVKVYRCTFSQNRKMERAMGQQKEGVPPFFRQPHFIDVTMFYSRNCRSKFQIPEKAICSEKQTDNIAYLCVSQRSKWIPVAWAAFERNNLDFSNIQPDAVMCVATSEGGRLIYRTDPFEVDSTGHFHFYSARGNVVEDVALYAKYNIGYDDEKLMRERMIGGVFEGSNDAGFKQKDTLHIIKECPGRLNTRIIVRSRQKYRYLRYFGPQDAHCNVAEVAFYDSGKKKLSGKIIGTPGCYAGDGSHEYLNVFDGKTWTSFDYKEGTGGWAGLDLGEPKTLSEIVYTPRNRDNYIRPGDLFELFYFQEGWRSLGAKMADSDSLLYERVPKGALLLLSNYSRGSQERIFVYDKGVQVWK